MASNKQKLRIRLSYDGTDFFGWQVQPTGEPTVQGLLEERLTKIYNQEIRVVGSGRTDRGVHAINQWAHFEAPSDRDHSQLAYKLNRMTPESIAVKSAEEAPEEFHAQISAVSKCYRYRIQVAPQANPFQTRYSLWRRHALDLKKLQKMAEIFLGSHDFSSFQSQGTPVSTPVREILISRWVQKSDGLFEYQIQGNGFLKQMVRNMVGTMLKLADQGADSAQLKAVLEARDRQAAAAPAPAQGLFLSSVQYPRDLDNKCRKL